MKNFMTINRAFLMLFMGMNTFSVIADSSITIPTIAKIDIGAEAVQVDLSFDTPTTKAEIAQKIWLFDEADLEEPKAYKLEKSTENQNSWSLEIPVTAETYRLSYLDKKLVTLAVIEKLSDELEGATLGSEGAYDAYDCSLDPTMCETEISANPIALMLMQQAACGAKPEAC